MIYVDVEADIGMHTLTRLISSAINVLNQGLIERLLFIYFDIAEDTS